jgi:hypothetical protein
MPTKTLIFIFTLMFLVSSCRYVGENVVNSQSSVEANVNTQTVRESNERISQSNKNNLTFEADANTFAKTFIVEGRFDDSKGTIYTSHLVEFRDNSKEISIYVDNKKKSFLKFETNHPEVRTDFLESNGERLFVLVVGASGFGTCGDSIFAIVKIDEKLEVKLSKTNEANCQGEFYNVKIENINSDKPKEYYRQISIGDLRFNLETFNWQKAEKKK